MGTGKEREMGERESKVLGLGLSVQTGQKKLIGKENRKYERERRKR